MERVSDHEFISRWGWLAVGPAVFGVLILGACLGASAPEPTAAPQKSGSSLLPGALTSGLIHWWPNVFDVHDEISGQDGAIMGVLPRVEDGAVDETSFGLDTGWVQLKPAITNDTFSACFWVHWKAWPDAKAAIVAQRASDRAWGFRVMGVLGGYGMITDELDDGERADFFQLPAGWNQVAISLNHGRARYWLNGAPVSRASAQHHLPSSSWLTVGNLEKGDRPWKGSICDLRVYDRVITDREALELFKAGVPNRTAKHTLIRRLATDRSGVRSISPHVAHVASHDKIYRHYTTEEGLPGNMVQTVLQTRDGYLWIGTEDGLARFDGHRFKNFTVENTQQLKVIGHDISCLAEASDGTLWAGTYGGLFALQNNRLQVFTNNLSATFIQQLAPTESGELWIVARSLHSDSETPSTLRRYNPLNGSSTSPIPVPGQIRRLVHIDGKIWLQTEMPNQLLHWDGLTEALSVAVNVFGASDGLHWTVASGAPAELRVQGWTDPGQVTNHWIQAGLFPDGPKFQWTWTGGERYPHPSCWTGRAGSEFWIGGRNGLARPVMDGLETIDLPNRNSPPNISALCEDREGGVWFGTEEDGLHLLQEKPADVITTKNGIAANDIRSVVATADGTMWVASSRGLNRLTPKGWEQMPGPRSMSVIGASRLGHLWLGMPDSSRMALQAIRCFDGKSVGTLVWDWGHPKCIRFASETNLWVLCGNGITWVNRSGLDSPTQQAPTNGVLPAQALRVGSKEGIENRQPNGLVLDLDGSAWIGSGGNVLIHALQNQETVQLVTNLLFGNACLPLHLDSQGALWIATDQGLVRKRGDTVQAIYPSNGIPRDTFYDLIEDRQHNFWLPGKRGIHRLQRADLEAFLDGRSQLVSGLTLGVADGLLTPECSSGVSPGAALDPSGRIWVPTRNGLAVIHPDKVEICIKPIPVVMERLIINQREFDIPVKALNAGELREDGSLIHYLRIGGTVGHEDALVLPPGSGQRVELHFSGLSLTQSDRVRFRFRLDGYDDNWLPDTDLRLAFYTNLRPGRYRFRVQAANSHGVWNTGEETLSFTIQPHFYQTAGFHVATGIALLFSLALLHFRRIRKLQREQDLQHQVDLNEGRARLAADMHDELGAALTRIAVLGECTKAKLLPSDGIYTVLEDMSQAARSVASGISELAWATNPSHDTLEALAFYLRGYAARQCEGTDIVAGFRFPELVPSRQVSAHYRRNVQLIWKEIIANLLKHSHASRVIFSLDVESSSLVLAIRDNGSGFDPHSKAIRGNGLVNLRKRVASLRGDWKLETELSKGTHWNIRLPL